MAIELIAKVAPKNEGFTGMVDADQVLGGGDAGTLPDACVAESNVTQHEAALTAFLRLLGVSGGQTAYGGTGSGDKLILKGSSHATPGAVEIGDEGDCVWGATGQSTPTKVETSVAGIINWGSAALPFGDGYFLRPRFPVSEAAFSDPPTDGELDSAFGTPATLKDNFFGVINASGGDSNVRDVRVVNGKWFYSAKLTEAV